MLAKSVSIKYKSGLEVQVGTDKVGSTNTGNTFSSKDICPVFDGKGGVETLLHVVEDFQHNSRKLELTKGIKKLTTFQKSSKDLPAPMEYTYNKYRITYGSPWKIGIICMKW